MEIKWHNADVEILYDDAGSNLRVGDAFGVMHSKEKPIMKAMVQRLINTPGSVLELGYGMGYSCKQFLQEDITSYTLIEINKTIAENAQEIIRNRGIVINDDWMNHLDIGTFDYVFFDTFPFDGRDADLRPEKYIKSFMHKNSRFTTYDNSQGKEQSNLNKSMWLNAFYTVEMFTEVDTMGVEVNFPICSNPKM